MCENRMCTCMCYWVTMLYSRKKNCVGEITIKEIEIKLTNNIILVSSVPHSELTTVCIAK